VIAKPARGGT